MFISIDHLGKDFRKKPAALDDVTLDLPQGMIGLLGSNGAGKTTLMRILCGIIQPTRGRVLIDGHDLADAGARRAVKKTLGYLPQDVEPYPNLTPLEFLDYVGVLKGIDSATDRKRQARELVAQVGLNDAKDRKVGGFSGGMRRRVGIAQALMGDPELLVVDEPTAGLDPEERMRFRTLLASLGHNRTVILSTHILDDVAQTCPYVFVLREGRLRYDGPTDGLIDAARGRTWLTASRTAPPPEDVTVVNATTTGAGTQYRIVTDTPPADATPVDPNLEDGYMALTIPKEHA
ncbi:ABC transporter ATP-binding protein [Corynebacterium freneyi]|uniref:ABC-type multidrug transport system ATPase subunit n=1 Tax=Corynebacterium freneyi TaxID=134034 RepID=A0ABS4U5H7_9CORY|nr:ABC transporter ATP-binding protein [Corynebacterium freneyi]MBP2331903.1 ABC-type multidrug transport system ATPase subunit [Corynebacterium freneyi]MDK8768157.1 ABC transporter ATP-binding protein [Corynebacterium freneyi]QXA53828.1 ABC transporter ATP-binding protein [Corynebacterium freneyi]WJZ05979.1 putative ABC transporter ATP-binding protein YxlF [Corynebacterium freneyi]